MLIVIPATKQHKSTVEISIKRLKLFYRNALIWIVCPNPLDFEDLRSKRVYIFPDKKFSRINKSQLKQLFAKNEKSLIGWYYQQILKYSIISSVKKDCKVLLLDADTILLDKFEPLKKSFFVSREPGEVYLDHFRMLIGFEPKLKKSPITNFMWFDPLLFNRMLKEIEMKHKCSWWQAIIQITKVHKYSFSEYVTYANWVSNSLNNHEEVLINSFRRAELLNNFFKNSDQIIKTIKLKGYQTATFELNHKKNLPKKILAFIILSLSVRYW
jgi:hypothetical protein